MFLTNSKNCSVRSWTSPELDPSNPGAFADVQTNPVTKKLLQENLREKLSEFAAALTGLGEPEIKGDICPDKYSRGIAQLLSPAEWEEELKWAQEDAWRLFHTPEVWKQVEEMVDDWIGRPEMIGGTVWGVEVVGG